MPPTIPPDPLRQHRCPYCPRYFTTSSELARHEKIHTVQKGFHCPKPDCDQAYPDVGQLNNHLKKSHEKLKCPVCKRELAKPETFERHVRKSHGGDYPADANFDKLLASLEGKSRKYQCSKCHRSYDVQHALRLHIRGTHPTDEERAAAPQFKCPICGAEFRKKADYRQHLRNIHQLDINKAGDLIKAAEKASESDQIAKAPPSQPVAQPVAQKPRQKKLTSFFGNDSQPSSSSTKKLLTLPPQMPVAGPTTAAPAPFFQRAQTPPSARPFVTLPPQMHAAVSAPFLQHARTPSPSEPSSPKGVCVRCLEKGLACVQPVKDTPCTECYRARVKCVSSVSSHLAHRASTMVEQIG